MLTSELSVKVPVSQAALTHAYVLGVFRQDLSMAENWRYHQHQVSLLEDLE